MVNYAPMPSAKTDEYYLNVESDANNDNEFDDTNECNEFDENKNNAF